MSLDREARRVAYILSYPEWYGHNVNDMFFRLDKWLFVPLQDLTPEFREQELRRASYFFISGYGSSQVAQNAYQAGCILVGVRADVPKEIPIIECGEWDPVDSYLTFLFVEVSRFVLPRSVLRNQNVKLNRVVWFTFQKLMRPIAKVFFLLRAAAGIWKKNGFRHVVIKTRNYFRKVQNI